MSRYVILDNPGRASNEGTRCHCKQASLCTSVESGTHKQHNLIRCAVHRNPGEQQRNSIHSNNLCLIQVPSITSVERYNRMFYNQAMKPWDLFLHILPHIRHSSLDSLKGNMYISSLSEARCRFYRQTAYKIAQMLFRRTSLTRNTRRQASLDISPIHRDDLNGINFQRTTGIGGS